MIVRTVTSTTQARCFQNKSRSWDSVVVMSIYLVNYVLQVLVLVVVLALVLVREKHAVSNLKTTLMELAPRSARDSVS